MQVPDAIKRVFEKGTTTPGGDEKWDLDRLRKIVAKYLISTGKKQKALR